MWLSPLLTCCCVMMLIHLLESVGFSWGFVLRNGKGGLRCKTGLWVLGTWLRFGSAGAVRMLLVGIEEPHKGIPGVSPPLQHNTEKMSLEPGRV